MEITLNIPLKIILFEYLCGLRPPWLCPEKSMNETKWAQKMENKGNIWQFLSKENHILNGASLPASMYDRLICAERHAILESFRMVLIEENIVTIYH